DPDAHAEDGKHDVGEHHRGVDAVRVDRLQRHLRAQLRIPDDVEQPVTLPQLAGLRQRASRLTHEPDRRAFHGLAATRPDEPRFPPRRYLLAVDLVGEHRFWLAELGNHSPMREVDVEPRQAAQARAFVHGDAERAPDWDQRVRAAHAEGYAAVGGAIRFRGGLLRRPPAELAPYAPNGGRNPAFAHPLVCPSLLPPLEPNAEVAGLPAWRPEGDEPWVYDARIVLTLRSRSGRRRG